MNTNDQNQEDSSQSDLTSKQLRDFADALQEVQEALRLIANKMEQHHLPTISSSNVKTAKKSLGHISKFVGAANAAFIFGLGSRVEELQISEVAEIFDKKRSAKKVPKK